MSDISFAEALATWAADSPAPNSKIAEQRAIDAFTDVIACMLAGSQNEVTLKVLDATIRTHGKGEQTVFGHEVKLPMAGAALVNGMSAHALDFDDNFMPGLTHATAVLAPALIAVGEANNCSGGQLIDAYVIGLELQARISSLVNPEHYQSGWHATSTVGTIGAAGAVAALLRLPAAQICAAMSIAFSLAAGSKLQFGSQTKPLHAGLAAHNAVLAAQLAVTGVGAQPDFLTGRWSFQDLYAPNLARPPEVAVENLGTQWAIEEFGLLAKRFPCCAASHKALDALEILRNEHGATLANLKHVVAKLPAPLYQNLRFDNPVTENEARFSFSYPATTVIREGLVSLRHFKPDAVSDPEIRAALPIFTRECIETDEKGVHADVIVTAEFQSGKSVEIKITDVRGGPNLPLSHSDMERKIADCLSWSGTEDQKPIFEKLPSLREIEDINTL
ncbi:MmgE/PrpD family protein [Sneathiella litorea]|uniref:MmgE/PrpD family protein n=1 Tax=Sneathiella litorea TaxID=2606216 RepID=A0A6L8W5J9_9PROT|nr:MmgE/PrpD family protein [Sneathiella litorea]MZR30416.1 MmgE/PrpD family protein [Sneathiella litorea]